MERDPFGRPVEPRASSETAGFWVIPAGSASAIDDRAVSAPMVREAIDGLARAFDVIVLSAGSLQDRLSSQFLLSSSDVGVLSLRPADRKTAVLAQIDRFDGLPRNGSVALMRDARPGDPWLAVRT